MTEEQVRDIIRDELQEFLASDRYIFTKTVQILDGRNIQTGRGTGTKIGTGTDQKIGFYNKTPVSQRLKANYSNWGALSNVVTALVDLGLFDQS